MILDLRIDTIERLNREGIDFPCNDGYIQVVMFEKTAEDEADDRPEANQ